MPDSLDDVIEREESGWGFLGYIVHHRDGGTSGYFSTREDAEEHARLEWPDLTYSDDRTWTPKPPEI